MNALLFRFSAFVQLDRFLRCDPFVEFVRFFRLVGENYRAILRKIKITIVESNSLIIIIIFFFCFFFVSVCFYFVSDNLIDVSSKVIFFSKFLLLK